MMTPLRALIVEDSEDDTLLVVEQLREGGYEASFARVDNAEAMRDHLQREHWDIVFADFTMPRFSALEALALLQQTRLDLPFIIVSGTIGEDRAVEAMKAGAHDYILKHSLKRLLPAVERELREARIRAERRQAEEKIQRLAYYDPLTGLPNRTLFLEQVNAAILVAERKGQPMALLLLDLDRFREVNHTLGHTYGDGLLIQVGNRLRNSLFQNDVVARLGGDEFGILLPRLSSAEDIQFVIRKVGAALEAPVVIDQLPILVEASLGVALAPAHATDAEKLLQRADVAMYIAKKTGSVHAVYEPNTDPHSPQRLALLGELRAAIERDQLVLHYQPKIDLASGRVLGVEALVRWHHPARGLLPPAEFITVAERTGLIRPLTDWVLSTALRQCAAWRRSGWELRVAVNLSARSLHDQNLPRKIVESLAVCEAKASTLELEITESAIIVDPTRALSTLTELSRLGVGISIDDFGTGYSSLSFIRKLPANEIKIDKSFVLGMAGDRSDEAIVRIVIELAHNLGLKVVGEGVENTAAADRLASLGCDFAQGYAIGRPLPVDELTAWLERYVPVGHPSRPGR